MDIKRYRIGNDLTVLWAINNRDGSPFDLEGKEVRLYISHPRGREEVAFELSTLPDGSINNVIRWDFAGEDQRTLGLYTLTIEIRNSADHKEIKKDYCAAFVLVGKSCEESADEGEANIMDGGELYLASQLDIYMLHVSGGSGDSGLIKKVYKESDFGGSFNSVSVSDTFNAHAINALYKRLNALATPSMGSLSDVELAALANEDVLIWDGSNFINTSAKELIEKYGGTGGSGGTVDLSNIYDRLTEIESWFELSEDGQTLTTDKNLASMGEVSAGGIAEEGSGSGGSTGIIVDNQVNGNSDNPVSGKGIKTYVDDTVESLAVDIKANPQTYLRLKSINGMSIFGTGNITIEGGSGSEGITAVNLNGESFQPDENGIIVLPDYPAKVSDLENDKKFISSVSSEMVTEALGFTPIGADALGPYAKTSEVNALISSLDASTLASLSAINAEITNINNSLADKAEQSELNALAERVSQNEGDIETILSWFTLSEDGTTLITDKNLASMGEVSAGGVAEEGYAVSAAAEMPASEGGLAKRIFSVPANTTYFNCVHNLGSRDIIIQVYEDGNGHQMVSPVVYLDNENTARIVFDGPTSIGHKVIIIG